MCDSIVKRCKRRRFPRKGNTEIYLGIIPNLITEYSNWQEGPAQAKLFVHKGMQISIVGGDSDGILKRFPNKYPKASAASPRIVNSAFV